MSHSVYWSAEAEAEVWAAFEYLLENWSWEVAENFQMNVDRLVQRLSQQPDAYPLVSTNIRKAYLSEHQYVLYTAAVDYVLILRLWGTRQNPPPYIG